MRRSFAKILSFVMVLAILCSLAVPTVLAAGEIKIPISIKLPYAVAGVEVEFSYSDSVTYTDWERTGSLKAMGYVSNKMSNGNTLAGIFTANNVIAPDENGIVDLGYLVFTGNAADAELKIASVEYTRVIDKDTMESGTYNLPEKVDLSLGSAQTVIFGEGVIVDAPVDPAKLYLNGPTTVDTDAEELTYTVSIGEVEKFATGNFLLELDAALVGEPVFQSLNGFLTLKPSAELVDGKWICEIMVFLPGTTGLTTDAPVDVLSVTVANKGFAGDVTATLTGATLSVYVGEGESYVDYVIEKASVETEIADTTEPPVVDPPVPERPNDGPVDSGVSINPDASTDGEEFPFIDVYRSDWYYDDVKDAWERDLIDGVTPTLFMPQKSLTVAEAIKLAAVLHQMDNDGKVTLSNGAPNWYDSYVDYAVEEGIIDSKYDRYTTAQMNAAITRAEFVYIFHGSMDNYVVRNTIADNAIPDVKTGDFAAKEIYEFYRAGICIGNDKAGTFLPNNVIKRCEVATIVNRMYNVEAREFIYLP